MSLLAPLGLLALLTLPVIVILHMLRERRRRVVVPSLLLWQLMPRRQEAQQRRRLPLTLLLLLHLLAAALLAFALARPQLPLALFGSEGHLAVIVDTSTSMAAPDGAGTRLDAAKARARALIGSVGARGSVTLIAAGPRPALLDAGGPDSASRLLAALDGLVAAGTGVDLPAALTLAEAALQGRQGARIVVLTDAAIPALGEGDGIATAVPLEFQRVGGDSDNRALVALAARPRSGSGPVQVYARAVNYGQAPLRTVLRLFGDDQLLDTRPVDLGPQGEAELTWAVPRGVRLLRAELDGDDGLPADDNATISLDQTRPIQALLVSANPAALERALRVVPGLELNTVTPIAYAGSDADLTIFEGFLPDNWSAGGVLAVHPPSGSPLLEVARQEREPVEAVLRLAPGSSALEGVSLGSVDFGRVRTLVPPAGFETLLSRGEQPLMLRGRTEASAVAVWAFDLSQGNLTSRLAFPLLVARTVRDLTPPALPASALLGEELSLRPDPRADRLEVGAPDGSVELLTLQPGEPAALTLSQTGIYTLVELAGERVLYTGNLGVNAGAAVESNLAPRPLPVAPPATAAALGADDGQRSLWPWLAAVALAVMLGEWLYVHGRRRALPEG